MRAVRTPCGILYTVPRLHGSPFDRCELPGILSEVSLITIDTGGLIARTRSKFTPT